MELALTNLRKVSMTDEMKPDEIRFLERHKIPISQVYDLCGQTVSSCYDEMVSEEKLFGYNATSCSVPDSGHTFVTRAGHCMECEPTGPRSIAEIRRHHGLGDVYLAGSLSISLITIGSATSADKRVPALNAVGYGGASDWRKLQIVRSVANAGKLEFDIHSRLEEFRLRDTYYMKDGKQQQCYELFSCSLETAIEVFNESKPKLAKIASVLPSELAKYTFPDRVTVKQYRVGNRR
jgi:hypothetical protein